MSEIITLTPIAMRVPSRDCIYAPSRLHQPKKISMDEFLERFANSATVTKVSFEPDGISNPKLVTAYGYGLDCWYILQ